MNIIKADIVSLWKQGKTVCVTTNGFIKKDGSAVMGRGNALAMSQAIPQLPINLGQHIKKYGNNIGFIYSRVIAFPVKPQSGTWDNALSHIKKRYKEHNIIPGYWCKASLSIIDNSMNQLNKLIEEVNIEEVYLPLPGTQNGQLKFEEVEPILKKGSSKIIYCSL